MNRRVFALEPTTHNVSDALRFGEIVYLYDLEERRPSMWTNSFLEDCMQRMEANGFSQDHDFILASGSHTLVLIWVTHLVSTLDTVHLLLFDSKQEEYVHRMV